MGSLRGVVIAGFLEMIANSAKGDQSVGFVIISLTLSEAGYAIKKNETVFHAKGRILKNHLHETGFSEDTAVSQRPGVSRLAPLKTGAAEDKLRSLGTVDWDRNNAQDVCALSTFSVEPRRLEADTQGKIFRVWTLELNVDAITSGIELRVTGHDRI